MVQMQNLSTKKDLGSVIGKDFVCTVNFFCQWHLTGDSGLRSGGAHGARLQASKLYVMVCLYTNGQIEVFFKVFFK